MAWIEKLLRLVKDMYDDVFGRKDNGKGLTGRKMKNRTNWKRIEVGESENKTDIPGRQFVFWITLGYLLCLSLLLDLREVMTEYQL